MNRRELLVSAGGLLLASRLKVTMAISTIPPAPIARI
jgi:hypothetical protein